MSFRANRRKITSIKSYDVNSLLLAETPPDRQVSPEQLQLISFAARVSLHPRPSLDARRGAITIVSLSAPARNAAASPVRKELSASRPAPWTTTSARVRCSLVLS